LVIDNILNVADRHAELRALTTDWSTAEIVNLIMTINTFFALVGVGFLLGGVFLVSVRPARADLTLEDLKDRVRVTRVSLILVSAILVLYVILSKLLLQWPLSLLRDAQALALQQIATALISYWSVAATLGMLAIFTPAIVAWQLDVESYRATRADQPQGAGQDKVDDGLEFARRSTVTALLAVVAPLLASPLADALKSAIGSLPVR
jgi:hypothetical protein